MIAGAVAPRLADSAAYRPAPVGSCRGRHRLSRITARD